MEISHRSKSQKSLRPLSLQIEESQKESLDSYHYANMNARQPTNVGAWKQ